MAVAFVAASVPCAASAMEPAEIPLRISESVHAGCPKRPALRERLEAHLGSVREAAGSEPAIDVAIAVERRGEVSVGTLTLTAAGASVQREASSTSCEDVIAALTVMAVIAIGEQAERLAPSTTEPPEHESEPPTSERPAVTGSGPTPTARTKPRTGAARVRPSPSAGSSKRLTSNRLTIALGSGFEVNGNRGAVLLGTWFAQVTFPVALAPTLRLGVARSAPERASVAPGAIALRWVEGIWAICADVYRSEGFRFSPCVEGEVGTLEASVIRPLPARETPAPWASIGASAKASFRILRPLTLELTAGARAPLVRNELFFEPYDHLLAYRAPVLAPFGAVGLVVDLP